MLSNTIFALSLIPVSLAHFTLDWPKARGFDDDKEPNFPCGGFDTVQQQRNDFPINGGPLQLNMGHEQTNVAVYMAVGNNPGSGFSVVMRPQFVVTGLGNFCIGQVSVPAGMNVTDGTPASIQVVTNAHGSGGLYQVCYTYRMEARGDPMSCTLSSHPLLGW
jgi:nascent polypeptide-associated complex subunit beta